MEEDRISGRVVLGGGGKGAEEEADDRSAGCNEDTVILYSIAEIKKVSRCVKTGA
jgi:hypothetical protein